MRERLLPYSALFWLRMVPLGAVICVLIADLIGVGPGWPVWLTSGILVVGAMGEALLVWPSRHGAVRAGAVLAVDGLLLTVLFAATDGNATPFAFLYVFPVLLAGLLASSGWAWAVFITTTLGYASLFVWFPSNLHHHDHSAMQTHIYGMFGAYAATAGLLVLAMSRIRAGEARAQAALRNAEIMNERTQRLTGLATLAAGAAHELGSPLSTIAVVAGEWARHADPALHEDAALIQDEVQRCRAVIDALGADSGSGIGEAPVRIDLQTLLTQSIGDQARCTATGPAVRLPVVLMGQALRRLVENAHQSGAKEVHVTATATDSELVLEVRDDGQGMTEDALQQATLPFYTTRSDGRGLGLYFVRRVIEGLGGTLSLTSIPGQGTTVQATLPLPSEGAP